MGIELFPHQKIYELCILNSSRSMTLSNRIGSSGEGEVNVKENGLDCESCVKAKQYNSGRFKMDNLKS